jgi:hypothetical protein
MSGLVHRVHFFCCECPYPTPAVWRVEYGANDPEAGSFWTLCEAHYRMAIRFFPSMEKRSRALLPDETAGAGIVPLHSSKARGNVIIGGAVGPSLVSKEFPR